MEDKSMNKSQKVLCILDYLIGINPEDQYVTLDFALYHNAIHCTITTALKNNLQLNESDAYKLLKCIGYTIDDLYAEENIRIEYLLQRVDY